jgi:hypothetical protein
MNSVFVQRCHRCAKSTSRLSNIRRHLVGLSEIQAKLSWLSRNGFALCHELYPSEILVCGFAEFLLEVYAPVLLRCWALKFPSCIEILGCFCQCKSSILAKVVNRIYSIPRRGAKGRGRREPKYAGAGAQMKYLASFLIGSCALIVISTKLVAQSDTNEPAIVDACLKTAKIRLLADKRTERFEGKVGADEALCFGGSAALGQIEKPWVDWQNYWATGGASSKSRLLDNGIPILDRNKRGVDGSLVNLEYQRMELIKFNLFDNNLTFEQYLKASNGAVLKSWKEMRLPPDNPHFHEMKIAADGSQTCTGKLIRFRTLTGICNDIRNPAMGSTQELLARNVEFESTFPDLERNQIARNRHGGRIGLLQPDPQVISRRLFTRVQSPASNCNQGRGVPGSANADCAYLKASFFNVLAAFWIQFMTHDWFSHLDESRNDGTHILRDLGCRTERVNNVVQPLSDDAAAQLGCRKSDHMDAALIADDAAPGTFQYAGSERLTRAYKTTRSYVTACWDA